MGAKQAQREEHNCEDRRGSIAFPISPISEPPRINLHIARYRLLQRFQDLMRLIQGHARWLRVALDESEGKRIEILRGKRRITLSNPLQARIIPFAATDSFKAADRPPRHPQNTAFMMSRRYPSTVATANVTMSAYATTATDAANALVPPLRRMNSSIASESTSPRACACRKARCA